MSTSRTYSAPPASKLPFGVGQVGKSFRNEITPGNFTFRTREFEQMELEFFCKPGTDLEWFAYWKDYCHNFLLSLGIKDENLRLRDHEPEELSHYSNATTDIEFLFPFGWGELWGIADRTDFDLTQHQKTSGVSMEYFDQETEREVHPVRHRAVPRRGPRRTGIPVRRIRRGGCRSGQERQGRRPRRSAPASGSGSVQGCRTAAVQEADRQGHADLRTSWPSSSLVDFDEAGSIGKRYRREDEIGTPFCVTVDFETEQDGCVTVRDRDTMQQERVKIEDVAAYIAKKIEF